MFSFFKFTVSIHSIYPIFIIERINITCALVAENWSVESSCIMVHNLNTIWSIIATAKEFTAVGVERLQALAIYYPGCGIIPRFTIVNVESYFEQSKLRCLVHLRNECSRVCPVFIPFADDGSWHSVKYDLLNVEENTLVCTCMV